MGGYGAVLQTGPASGFRFLCEGGSCAKKLRGNRWPIIASDGPTARGTRNMRRGSVQQQEGSADRGGGGAVVGKQRERAAGTMPAACPTHREIQSDPIQEAFPTAGPEHATGPGVQGKVSPPPRPRPPSPTDIFTHTKPPPTPHTP